MIKRNGDCEYPCLIPNLRGKTLRLLSLSIMLGVVALYFFCFVCFVFRSVTDIIFCLFLHVLILPYFCFSLLIK